MFAQKTRVFSQDAELSQIENIEDSQNYPQNSIQQHTHDSSEEYNMVTAPTYPQEASEGQLSVRAEAICEENRRITDLVQSSLKKHEKRRINLMNKKTKIEEEVKVYLEIHERQRRESVETQMNLEELTGNYQKELNERPKLMEKVKDAELLVEMFDNYYTNGLTVGEEIKAAKKHLETEKDTRHKGLETVKQKKNQIELLFKTYIEKNIKKAQKHKETIDKEKEDYITEAQELILQNDEKANKISYLEKEIKNVLKVKENLNNIFNTISLQNKTLFEGISDLHLKLDECRAVGVSDIQNLKLQINTEQNNNTNLELKFKEKEDYFNSLSTKQKGLTNLSNQLKSAVENASKANKEQLMKIEECSAKKTGLKEQINYFAEEIKKYLNAEEDNDSFKKTLFTLEEDIKLCSTSLKEKEDVLYNLNDQIAVSKRVLLEIEGKKVQADSELEKCRILKHELISKETEENMSYKQERDMKMKQCSNMEQENKDLSDKENELKMNIEELIMSNKKLENKLKEIEKLIEKYNQDTENSRKELFVTKKENEEYLNSLKEELDEKYNRLETYEALIIELRPKQEKVIVFKAKIEALVQDLHNQYEQFEKEKKEVDCNFNVKTLELDREVDNYKSVMEKILKSEEEATEKLTVEIQETEIVKMKLREELKSLHKELNILKSKEMYKRDRVSKMENRLRTINNEIKVTKKDFTDVMTRKIQDNVKKWVESVPVDEYEFSDI
ncbi:repetitive organellar protein-like isoform X2 [Homalodisca vitripennis]|uniref:repetitive organellar protein-like isoform X2 n=1 Tax=Homalodisca vitripennis TaxID=197043 RepID=UPI001EEA7CCC|nr:repetitive organellar protein-like isoform X2 [Homalodisca vitripennis]